MPSHLIDNVNDPREIYKIAVTKQVSFTNLAHNKAADRAASAVLADTRVDPFRKQIVTWQRWLLDLALLLADTKPRDIIREPLITQAVPVLSMNSSLNDFQKIYPL